MVATKRKIVPLFSGLLVSGLVFGLNVNVSGAADNGSVAQLEAQLAKQTTEAQNALIQVQVMGEKANTARESARTASAKAEKARKDAQEANGKLEDARKSLAGISTTVYRQNGSLSSLAPYLEADGLETVEMKRVAVELFGTKASKKMQSYSALKEVAGVIEQRADKAEQAAKASAAAADRSLNAAQATADAAQRQVQEFQNKRNEIIANLAKARGTDVATETANQNARAAQRIARENNAAADRLGVPKSERPSASAVARSGGSVVEPVLRPPAAPRPAPTPAPRPAPKPAP
ncbi:MAG: hypothetical protein Q4A71_08445, partial [Actinomycetaceae bacterium]|nr:hypothetical protein [Actinomycetaceae bacterium]